VYADGGEEGKGGGVSILDGESLGFKGLTGGEEGESNGVADEV
jgi:hypothetical protein